MAGSPSNMPPAGGTPPGIPAGWVPVPGTEKDFPVPYMPPAGMKETAAPPVETAAPQSLTDIFKDKPNVDPVHIQRQIDAISAIGVATTQPPPTSTPASTAKNDPISDELLDRVAEVESSNNPLAVSPKGARGLFQIMPATAAQYGVTDPNKLDDPTVSRQLAKTILTDLYQRYGNIPQALAAYNAGSGNVDKGILPQETRNYLDKVLYGGNYPEVAAAQARQQASIYDKPLETGDIIPTGPEVREHPIASALKIANDYMAATGPGFYAATTFADSGVHAAVQHLFPNHPAIATATGILSSILVGHGITHGLGPEKGTMRILGADGEPIELPESQVVPPEAAKAFKPAEGGPFKGPEGGQQIPLTQEAGEEVGADVTRKPRTWQEDNIAAVQNRLKDTTASDTKFLNLPDRAILNSTDREELRLTRESHQDNLSTLGQAYTTAQSPEEQQAFAKLFSDEFKTYTELLGAKEGVGTETGQALNIHKRDTELSKEADELTKNATPQTMDQVMRGFASLGTSADKARKAEELARSWIDGDTPYKALMNARLLNPRVVAVKFVSDLISVTHNAVHQALAMAMAHPTQIPIAGKMLISSMQALFRAIPEAAKFARETFSENTTAMSKAIAPELDQHSYGQEVLDDIKRDGSSVLSEHYPDKIIHWASSVFGVGTRSVMTMDQFSRTIGYRMEEQAQAYYSALQEVLNEGELRWVDAMKRANTLANLKIENGEVRKLAYGNSMRDTYTDSDSFTNAAKYLSNMKYVGPMFKVLFPFLHTNINIWEQGMMNSPFAFMTAKFWDDMSGASKLGGLTKATDMAKWATGSMLTAWSAWETMKGHINGDHPASGDPNDANTFRHGDTSVGFEKLGALALPLRMGANFAEHWGHFTNDERNDFGVAIVKAFAEVMGNAPGIDDGMQLMQVMHEAEMGGPTTAVAKWLGSKVSSFIPATASQIAGAMSPTVKKPQGASPLEVLWETIEKNIPGLSDKVHPVLDMWGDPQYIPPGETKEGLPPHWYWSLLSSMNPYTVYQHKQPDELDKEIMRLEPTFGRTHPYLFPKEISDYQIPLTPDQQYQLDSLSGKGKLAQDTYGESGQLVNKHTYMMNMIHSKEYTDIPNQYPGFPKIVDQKQREYLEKAQHLYNELAKTQLAKTNPDIAAKVAAKDQAHIQHSIARGSTPILGAP